MGNIMKSKIFSPASFETSKYQKPPYLPFPKMIEFCHFSYFSCLPEKNYNLQSLWITLYSGLGMGISMGSNGYLQGRGCWKRALALANNLNIQIKNIVLYPFVSLSPLKYFLSTAFQFAVAGPSCRSNVAGMTINQCQSGWRQPGT